MTILGLFKKTKPPEPEFEVKVEYQNEDAPAHMLWVGMLDDTYKEIVNQKSIILRTGKNKIKLTWRNFSGYAAHAALYFSKIERHEWAKAPIKNPRNIELGDEAHLEWNINFEEPRVTEA